MSFEEYVRNWYKRAVVCELVGGDCMGVAGSLRVAWAELQVWCNGDRRHHGKNGLKDGRLRLTLYSPVVTICTASLTFNNLTFCPHSVFYVFCVDLRTNSDYFPIQY
jgi:hypothetical protein